MRRLVLFVGLAASALVIASFAAAAPPTHTTTTGSGTFTFPAGTLCDFNYQLSFTFTDDITTFSDGRVETHETFQDSNTNSNTGYTLTDTDRINVTLNGDKVKSVGLFWHLRDTDGKLVVVHAGERVVDPSGLVKFTPNSGPDFAAVICPALGGNPA
jgi:hypothetical protein